MKNKIHYKYSKMVWSYKIGEEIYYYELFKNIRHPIKRYLEVEFGIKLIDREKFVNRFQPLELEGFFEDYEILGVNSDDAVPKIKMNFRKLAKKYHPDICEDKNANERFKRMVKAYKRIISNFEYSCIHDNMLSIRKELEDKYRDSYIVYPDFISHEDKSGFLEYYDPLVFEKLKEFINGLPCNFKIVNNRKEAIKIKEELNNLPLKN